MRKAAALRSASGDTADPTDRAYFPAR